MTLHLSQIFFTDARTFINPAFSRQLSALSKIRGKKTTLFISVHNSSAVQIVGRELDRDFVSGQNADKIFAHLAGNVRQHLVFAFRNLHLKHGVRQRFYDRRHYLNRVFFAHSLLSKLLAFNSQLGFKLKADG
jgi:hypothetical protein